MVSNGGGESYLMLLWRAGYGELLSNMDGENGKLA